MSYCVNCGVELNPGAEECPLCGTPAWNPDPETPRYFPTKPPEILPVQKQGVAILLTAMLVSVAVCCGLLNLILLPSRLWCFYVIGAAAMLWVWFVLPMVFPRLPLFFRLALDVAAIGIYVWLISIDLNGSAWFQGLALPILGWACVLVCLLSLALRGRSILTRITLCIGSVGLLVLGIEFSIDRFLHSHWDPGWSLVVLAVCVALIIPLRVVRRVPSLREEVRRRFDL